jgi:hypothetical protein
MGRRIFSRLIFIRTQFGYTVKELKNHHLNLYRN